MKQASLRHNLLSENLANVNTPGYKRKDIDFGIELEKASSRMIDKRHGAMIKKSDGGLRRDGNSVDLESEVANMAETEFRYRLLTDMTNRYFTGLKSVIREGR
ncbi:MAG: flagellar basal body rod protein FlgB [Chthonomonas sp.]|nr:flagellar basal body rod protein FlgB [Chthonomonas sp.]